ncbi:hypothetical protein Hypma_013891 [Hypsizygus marmoreus]|uniref:NYN domain-containing protein n=1 Tax=Hypsizygus marmoreus TaxID=39966 RepID=A0A369K8N3_HYPMA|nr:hypothetical protein Hypma_013891 [Hypsizygus marmoreus]
MPASTSQSSEDTASPRVPISPFSFASSSDSHYTSDSLPDLGAFNTVLREWVYLQRPPRIPTAYHAEATSASASATPRTERTDSDTFGTGRRSTVWNHQPIAEYLHVPGNSTEESGDTTDTDTEGARSVVITVIENDDSDDQGTYLGATSSSSIAPEDSYTLSPLLTQPSLDDSSMSARDVDLDMDGDLEVELEMDPDLQPSLGALDEALSYIAAERAKVAQRAGATAATNATAWKHVIEPRRKRRRKRPGKGTASLPQPQHSSLFNAPDDQVTYDEDEQEVEDEADEELEGEGDDEFDDSIPRYHNLYSSKSTPVTPTPRRLRINPVSVSSDASASLSASTSSPKAAKPPRKRSRGKSSLSVVQADKPKQILKHSISTPSFRRKAIDDEQTTPRPEDVDVEVGFDGETRKLLNLTRELGRLFPADRDTLADVQASLRMAGKRRSGGGDVGLRPGGGDEWEEEDGDGEDGLDPRGREAEEHDPPVHVFVDHSNILIGLLTYLKRHEGSSRTKRPKGGAGAKSAIPNTIPDQKPPKPKPPSPTKPKFDDGSTEANVGKVSRPLPPIPTSASSTSSFPMTSPAPVQTHSQTMTPIPLPSFATAARSINTTTSTNDTVSPPTSPVKSLSLTRSKSKSKSKLKSKSKSTYVPNNVNTNISQADGSVSIPIPMPISASTSDDVLLLGGGRNVFGDVGAVRGVDSGGGAETTGGEDSGGVSSETAEEYGDESQEVEAGQEREPEKKKRPIRHLSHTALALILERGRPIKRRALVASSPLYQPLDTMERLGYEVRVYVRVPDYGDGMDRTRYTHGRSSSGGAASSIPTNAKKSKGHARRVSGSTSADSVSASASTSAGEAKGLARSAIAPPSSLTSLVPSHTHPHQHLQHQHPLLRHGSSGGVTTGRVRYREQGVDELLQLKLHQVLAAADKIPPGSTIVLATGDGNVSQFNEDGFLGPIRIALKNGWRVELYAWETGLSRAWRREFGEGSEWERSGMFRIIFLEQFAESLAKGGA